MNKCVLFYILLTILFVSCTQQEPNKSDPPEKVSVVLRIAGADTLQDERGIDAFYNTAADSNGIQLMWYDHPEKRDISYYKIFRSDDPEGQVNYRNIGSRAVNQAGQIDTIFFDTFSLQLGMRYYYYITAVSKKDKEGENSDTLSYKLVEHPIGLSLNGGSSTIDDTLMSFSWRMASGVTPDQYILRIEYVLSEDFHPLVFVKNIQSLYEPQQTEVLSGSWLQQKFSNGQYRWRVDCIGPNENLIENYSSGSESEWKYFTVSWGG